MINRKIMAKKCGLSYDLLRYYERSLSNILRLKKGSNNQVLFDEKAESIIMEAVSLKKANGYSMKQLFQHFNHTSRLDGEHHSSANKAEECKKWNNKRDDHVEDSSFNTEKTMPTGVSSPAVIPSSGVMSSSGGASPSNFMSSHELVKNIGTTIGEQVATALTVHSKQYEENMVVLANAIKEIGIQNHSIYTTSQNLVTDNNYLRNECNLLSSRLNQIEESIKEQKEQTIGKKFWRWFFGAKKDVDRNLTSSCNMESGHSSSKKQSESFAAYFKRFMKNPVAVDKDAHKDIHSVGCFAKNQ